MKKCPYRGVEDCVYLGGGDTYSGTCRGEASDPPLCRYRPAVYGEGTTVSPVRSLTYHEVWYDRTDPKRSRKVRQMESRNHLVQERSPAMEKGTPLRVMRTYCARGEIFVMTEDPQGNLHAIHEGYLKAENTQEPAREKISI